MVPNDCFRLKQEVHPQVSHLRISPLGPWAPTSPEVAKLTPLLTLWRIFVSASKCSSESNSGVLRKILVNKGEITNWSFSATFWETNERFPAVSLVIRTKKDVKAWEVCQARVGQVYPFKSWGNPKHSNTNDHYSWENNHRDLRRCLPLQMGKQ